MLPASQLHPACLPIEVSIYDPFYARKKIPRYCMNFVRTVAGVRNNCSLGYADQVTE
jgi:peroxidase